MTNTANNNTAEALNPLTITCSNIDVKKSRDGWEQVTEYDLGALRPGSGERLMLIVTTHGARKCLHFHARAEIQADGDVRLVGNRWEFRQTTTRATEKRVKALEQEWWETCGDLVPAWLARCRQAALATQGRTP